MLGDNFVDKRFVAFNPCSEGRNWLLEKKVFREGERIGVCSDSLSNLLNIATQENSNRYQCSQALKELGGERIKFFLNQIS